ncbi:hypothetical protein ACFQLX_07290 [Streptomyces polyrhachis]|uniref:Serine protease n=1 Tax=Streptomyces polyrhachis TaxID=1282885 RepID=A0ABW2GB17_9ACTN
MAHTPHGQAPDPNYDPAGSTQMFRAFVDEGAPQGQPRQPGHTPPQVRRAAGGSRLGLIVGVLVVLAAVAGAAWIALG